MPKSLLQFPFKGKTYIGETHSQIHNNIIKEHQFNSSNLPSLNDVERGSTNYNKNTGFQPYKAPTPMMGSVSMSEAINGAKAILRLAAGQRVEDKEMERRASICKYAIPGGCPKLQTVSGCKACGTGAAISSFIGKLKGFFGGKKLEIPNNLSDRYCGVCGCSLAIMLPSKTEAFDFAKDNQKDRPSFCWIKKGGQNFVES
jgi:hypothetical protein